MAFSYFVNLPKNIEREPKPLLSLLCRKVPAAPHKPPADTDRMAAVFRGLQPGSDVLPKPWKVRPLPHLQSGE